MISKREFVKCFIYALKCAHTTSIPAILVKEKTKQKQKRKIIKYLSNSKLNCFRFRKIKHKPTNLKLNKITLSLAEWPWICQFGQKDKPKKRKYWAFINNIKLKWRVLFLFVFAVTKILRCLKIARACSRQVFSCISFT